MKQYNRNEERKRLEKLNKELQIESEKIQRKEGLERLKSSFNNIADTLNQVSDILESVLPSKKKRDTIISKDDITDIKIALGLSDKHGSQWFIDRM